MRSIITVGCVLCLLACARNQDTKAEATASASGTASDSVIRSADEICNLLTAEEVSAEMKQPVTPRVLPKSGQYSAPVCGWLTTDAPDAPGFLMTLFFHPDSERGPSNFTKKIKDVCTDPVKEINGLGDEAALCSKLLVRKGNVFFILSREKDDSSSSSWADGAQRLARQALSRLP